MKVVVLGAGGLLGYHISHAYSVIALQRKDCDITNNKQLHEVLVSIKPDVIINCAGVVPKACTDIEEMFRVNAIAPRFIAEIANHIGAYLVHVSTDCVFNGAVGSYYEDVIPCPKTAYGMSKLCGEIVQEPHVTIRTSFVGLPDPKGHGLLAWAEQENIPLTQSHPIPVTITGYDKAMWNGVTALELSHLLFNQIIPERPTGIIHMFGETISKFELLWAAAEEYDWNFEIVKQSEVQEPLVQNRTLSTLYGPYCSIKTFREQLQEMKHAYSS